MHPHSFEQVSRFDSFASELDLATLSLEAQLDFRLNVDVIIDFSVYFKNDAIFPI